MKKSLRKTCAVVLAAATTAGIAGAAGATTLANFVGNGTSSSVKAEVTDKVMAISSFKSSVYLGDTFTMPTATFEGNAITTYTVVAPSGKEQTVTEGKFKVNEVGTYTITYTSGNYSGSVTFRSTTSKYTIELQDNTSRVLPTKVGKSFDGDLYVPGYVVKDKNGDKVNDADVEITVTSPNIDVYTVDANGKINFGDDELVTGTYTVYYRVTMDGYYITDTKKSFKVVEGEAYSGKTLELSYSSEKPESVNIGKPVTLPSLSATLGDDSVNIYYTVEVYKNGTEKLDPETEVHDTTVLAVNENGRYEFTANEAASYYKVKYNAVDALGNTASVEFSIETVEDTLAPTPIVVNAYDTDDVDSIENVDYALPSYFGTDGAVKILAVYAEDFGSFEFSDYKFERRIENSNYEVLYTDTEAPNKYILFNTASGYEAGADEVIALDADGEKITLAEGKYTVYYKATDAAGNKKEINYTFEVDADYNDYDGIPEVEFNDTFFSAVDKGDTIEFSKPTYNDSKDERLNTRVTYQYFDSANDAVGGEVELELGSGSKYSIDTAGAPNDAAYVRITAYAVNDIGNEGKASKDITIYSEFIDTVAPVVYSVGTYTATATQGDEITLPTIVFEDDDISSLNASISVVCKDANDNEIQYTVSNAKQIKVANNLLYDGGKFVAATAGTYTVAVSATDAAGNVVIKFLEYTVSAASYTGELRFGNIGLSNSTIELGESFKLPEATIIGDANGEFGYFVVVESDATSKVNQYGNYKFTPPVVGEYKVKYVMYKTADYAIGTNGEILGTKDAQDDEYGSIEFTVTVKDTTAPNVYVDWSSEAITLPGANTDETGAIAVAYEKGTKILLPTFSADDLSGIDATKSVITITNTATSSTRTIKYSDMASEYAKYKNGESSTLYYTFSQNAEYTVTYTAYDNEGNQASQKFTVKVGDLDAPVLEVSDKIIKSSYKIGNTITIDLNDDSLNYFTITDGDDKATVENIKVKLTRDGSEVKNTSEDDGVYKFTLDDAGSYELTFTVTDAAGNESDPVVKTFEIASNESKSVSRTQAVGTILIVISVVVLGGVIVYFVISKRKMDKIYK